MKPSTLTGVAVPDRMVVSGFMYVIERLDVEMNRRIGAVIDRLFAAWRLAMRFIIGAVNAAEKSRMKQAVWLGAGNSRSKVFNRLPTGLNRLLATPRVVLPIRKSANPL
jgi:hypothetical protein